MRISLIYRRTPEVYCYPDYRLSFSRAISQRQNKRQEHSSRNGWTTLHRFRDLRLFIHSERHDSHRLGSRSTIYYDVGNQKAKNGSLISYSRKRNNLQQLIYVRGQLFSSYIIRLNTKNMTTFAVVKARIK